MAKPKINIEKNKAQAKFPSLALFMGLPKIGKSRVMAKLPKTLILDLEGKGYDAIDVEAVVKATTLADVKQSVTWFFSAENTDYETLVIDHLRILTSFYSKQVAHEGNVDVPEQVPYGQGSSLLKHHVEYFIKTINTALADQTNKRVFLVAHAIDRNGEVRLDIDGKNESMVLSLVDAVGFISRNSESTNLDDPEESLLIDFGAKGGTEYGCRNPYLAKYTGNLEWSTLFKVAEGKVDTIKS